MPDPGWVTVRHGPRDVASLVILVNDLRRHGLVVLRTVRPDIDALPGGRGPGCDPEIELPVGIGRRKVSPTHADSVFRRAIHQPVHDINSNGAQRILEEL